MCGGNVVKYVIIVQLRMINIFKQNKNGNDRLVAKVSFTRCVFEQLLPYYYLNASYAKKSLLKTPANKRLKFGLS